MKLMLRLKLMFKMKLMLFRLKLMLSRLKLMLFKMKLTFRLKVLLGWRVHRCVITRAGFQR